MLSDQLENDIIRSVQNGVPFTPRPFAEIGERVGVSEAEVIELLSKWTEQGKLREISAVLEGSALGYESALVAGRVADADLDRTVAIINGHPTVTHNYLRDHDFNLWYTIAVPFEMGLDETVATLSRMTGAEFHSLRRTETFKIGVNFDIKSRQNNTDATPLTAVAPVTVTPSDAKLFRALQTPAPIVAEPFDVLARDAGVDTGTLLEFARHHLGGALRRYVGTLRHRKLGVRANAMIVWSVPEEEISSVGQVLAQAPEVSHCYGRNSIEGFPYTLYSMIHGPDLEDCRVVATRISDEIGVTDYRLLVSLEEFKKTRLRYFLPELDTWWQTHGAN